MESRFTSTNPVVFSILHRSFVWPSLVVLYQVDYRFINTTPNILAP